MARFGGKTATHTITATTEVDLLTGIFSSRHLNRGLTVFVRSTQAGTAKVYYVDPGGTSVEMEAKIMAAEDMHVFDYDHAMPEAKVTFTASSASGTVVVEALHY